MAHIIGVDAGNSEVKVFGEKGALKFSATLSEWHEFRLKPSIKETDVEYNEWEYEGEKGFAGKLAEREGLAKRNTRGTSKAHKDVVIRTLIALHRYGTFLGSKDFSFKIAVGNPVESFTQSERKEIKRLLEKTHVFKLNKKLKEIVIEEVEVVAEGAAAYWAAPKKGLVRILDFGSGTVNGVSVEDGEYIDSQSFTIDKGLETDASISPEVLWSATWARCLDKSWRFNDQILLVGGAADKILEIAQQHLTNVQVLEPSVKYGDDEFKIYPSIYANAIGLYEIAKDVFE